MKKIYNSFAGFILFHFARPYMFQEHNFIKKDHPELWRAKKVSKKVGVDVVCVCFFIDFPLRQHGISLCFHLVLPKPYSHLARFSSLRVCSCLTTSHPPENFHKHFFPWQQRKSSFVFCRFLRRNLFFTSRCKRQWNGGSTYNRVLSLPRFCAHKSTGESHPRTDI